ncbi:MAG: hypothetical protein Ct9H300mP12_07870 [Acidimicrobiales bacterium]|nr:MAG: hypothetical protein Ct9H300mP12_07870 [Acidimicrobiales bacterium]
MAASASAGAELEPVVGEVVEHGGPLGNTDRVFPFPGRETGDGRAEVDVVGLGGHPAHYGAGADMWLYSVRPWCSPNQTYFQLCLSARMAYSASRRSSVCSLSLSWAAGPGV